MHQQETTPERPSNKDLKTINQRIRRLEEENCKKKDQLEAVTKRLEVVEADQVQTTERMLFLERQMAQALANNRKPTARLDLLKNNSQLKIDGKAEVAGEDLKAYVTAIATALGTTIDDNDIAQIYRIGKKTGGNRKRPIMVKFMTVAKRNAV